MFSQASVCSQGCVSGVPSGGVSRGVVCPGGMWCVQVPGGVSRGWCVGGGVSRNVCSDPPSPRYGQPAVGTHPTGMNSCFFVKLGRTRLHQNTRKGVNIP